MPGLIVTDSDTVQIDFKYDPAQRIVYRLTRKGVLLGLDEKPVEAKNAPAKLLDISTTWQRLSWGANSLIVRDSFMAKVNAKGENQATWDSAAHKSGHLRYCLVSWTLDQLDPFLKLEREKIDSPVKCSRLTDACFEMVCSLPPSILDPIINTAIERLHTPDELFEKNLPESPTPSGGTSVGDTSRKTTSETRPQKP